jgi:hypothetical protein
MTERRISVPQDVSIVGFDNIPAAASADPPLTTRTTLRGEDWPDGCWYHSFTKKTPRAPDSWQPTCGGSGFDISKP